MIYYLIIVGILIFDRVVKYLVSSGMAVGETIPLIENVFHITYVQNRGAAFSMWEQQWIVLILLPAVVMLAGIVLIFIKRNTWSRFYLISAAFICGGGLGNLIDRITQGYVVDLFDFRVFPVFNIADIFICAGCGLLLLYVVFFERKHGGNGQ
ncbi:MAG: signal peptidase II [Bacillota bacterium]|nr:signal peptidase II [Bacillota bacterium]